MAGADRRERANEAVQTVRLPAEHATPPDIGRTDWSALVPSMDHRSANSLEEQPIQGHIAPMLIRTEQTPNPATRKFLPGQAVMEAGTRDFLDAESAEASPLAKALFDSGLVE